mmetsp:Transcript_5443/g.16185  ORF Transcript_5443/g.16185 Transcript_5443/m.16185 type:complete len:246 (-) Transcript_5443:389-1126(-)
MCLGPQSLPQRRLAGPGRLRASGRASSMPWAAAPRGPSAGAVAPQSAWRRGAASTPSLVSCPGFPARPMGPKRTARTRTPMARCWNGTRRPTWRLVRSTPASGAGTRARARACWNGQMAVDTRAFFGRARHTEQASSLRPTATCTRASGLPAVRMGRAPTQSPVAASTAGSGCRTASTARVRRCGPTAPATTGSTCTARSTARGSTFLQRRYSTRASSRATRCMARVPITSRTSACTRASGRMAR